jgi:lipopolysaccharide transport system ATP-binding protein
LNGRVASLLEVGTGFHQELTGRENIYLNGAILGMTRSEIRRKFDEIVAFSEVERFLDTPVKRYSSGMYVRLAFAIAAHLEPEILVVDEVLAVGDAEFQKKCLGKMGEVAKSGRTVLFVSHNLAAIRTLCDRGIVLTNGRKSFDGTAIQASEVYGLSSQLTSGKKWERPSNLPSPEFSFQEVSASLLGDQPSLKLLCEMKLRCSQSCSDAFIAIDIWDSCLAPIIQAIPDDTPYIPGRPGTYTLQVRIDLPPLVPGIYSASFWIGSAHTQTLDNVREVLTFEVTDSPMHNRTVPHSADHGFMVAPSRCVHLSRVETRSLPLDDSPESSPHHQPHLSQKH